MKALIGDTGFVGSNLRQQISFERHFNSRNITSAFDEKYELVVYCGVKAEKFIANQNPQQDYEHIKMTIDNLKKLKMDKLVLISTIDVYSNGEGVDETTIIEKEKLQPYGYHRYLLEEWVREYVPSSLIVRLPALYGINLKKNFIFDMMTVIPSMIKQEKFEQLKKLEDFPLEEYYTLQKNGFYLLNTLSNETRKILKTHFTQAAFNALSFTDSRNKYQFYPLRFLWNHIQLALEKKLSLLALTSEPVSAEEIYQAVFGKTFNNHILEKPLCYNLKSRYAEMLGGNDGYFFTKEFIMKDVAHFICEERNG